MGGISRRTGLAAVALCAMAGMTATPVDAGGAIASNLFLSLANFSFFQPTDPCTPGGEQVTLTGNAHVVAIIAPNPPPISQGPQPPPIKLHFNMADATGIGMTTGNTYIPTGAATFDVVPLLPITQGPLFDSTTQKVPMVQFNLESTVGCAAQPLVVGFVLRFDGTLHLDPAGTGPCTGETCPTPGQIE